MNFETLQDFAPDLYIMRKINTMQGMIDSKEELIGEFNKEYNKPKIQESSFTRIDDELIDLYCSSKRKAVVSRGNFLYYDKKRLVPVVGNDKIFMIPDSIESLVVNKSLKTNWLFTIINDVVYPKIVRMNLEIKQKYLEDKPDKLTCCNNS